MINEDATFIVIDKIAKTRSINGAFAYYDKDDIYQEVWYMCLDAMSRYNEQYGPVENYLNKHVSNRYKNLKRDKYFQPGHDPVTSGYARTQMDLVNALPLDSRDEENKKQKVLMTSSQPVPVDYLVLHETIEYIIARLPAETQVSFNKLINGGSLRKNSLAELQSIVAEILAERENG